MFVDDATPEFDPELQALVARARAGDAGAIDPLRARLAATPGLYRQIGELAAVARAHWVSLIAGDDPAARAALEAELGALHRALAGPAPTPMEALLADRVVLCWAQLQHADGMLAQPKDRSLEQGTWLDRRASRLERRLQTAVGALAAWRRLGGDAATVVAPAGHEDGDNGQAPEPGHYPRLVAAIGRRA